MSDHIQIEPVIGWPAYCDEIMSLLSLTQLEVSNLKDEVVDLNDALDEQGRTADARKVVIGQRETLLRECLAWVRHWRADVAGNLKPTPDSLAMVEAKIVAVLGDAK